MLHTVMPRRYCLYEHLRFNPEAPPRVAAFLVPAHVGTILCNADAVMTNSRNERHTKNTVPLNVSPHTVGGFQSERP